MSVLRVELKPSSPTSRSNDAETRFATKEVTGKEIGLFILAAILLRSVAISSPVSPTLLQSGAQTR